MQTNRPRVVTTLLAATLAGGLATGLVVGSPGGAGATTSSPRLAPATTYTMTVHQDGSVVAPTRGDAIPNLDSVKATLRAFYGATKGPDPDTAAGAPATIYLPNLTSSPYARDVEALASQILGKLPATAPSDAAVVFDVDSTLLSDYANEEEMNFNYNPATNARWVTGHLFPAVPGMPALVRALAREGYRIYGITGRPGSQESDTIANLTAQGYTSDGTANGTPLFTPATLYTKDTANQPWVDCSLDGDSACSTVEYKALTRAHIQSADHVRIVMNVGDQWSDLEGGYADAFTKLPNPSYFLPSADIPGAPASDATMVLPSRYRMLADGSTGATATDGDALPNEGAVTSEIRAFYGATNGIASRTSSPYLSQMKALSARWTKRLVPSCRTAARHHRHPAVVFDVDDTMLWTYDMEDGAMKFAFDPALQNGWVQGKKFAAVPHMVKLEKKVKRAGCTVVGLTGRTKSQGKATLKNLKKVGYRGFTRHNFYFKPNTGKAFPKYLHCRACTTVQYKSGTRKYLATRRHFTIVASLGDQFSDLKGGHAKKKLKLPNPTYYLP
jgi:predicted secreted acid phosphatase